MNLPVSVKSGELPWKPQWMPGDSWHLPKQKPLLNETWTFKEVRHTMASLTESSIHLKCFCSLMLQRDCCSWAWYSFLSWQNLSPLHRILLKHTGSDLRTATFHSCFQNVSLDYHVQFFASSLWYILNDYYPSDFTASIWRFRPVSLFL